MANRTPNLGNKIDKTFSEDVITIKDVILENTIFLKKEIDITKEISMNNDVEKEKKLSIPDLPLEEFEIPENTNTGVFSSHGGSVEVAFVGVGQGGSRLAESFYGLGYKKCIVMNTALHDLHHINVPDSQKLHIGDKQSGAGKNMEMGKLAAENHKQELYNKMLEVFGTNVDRIFVTVGAGGGTGGGSCETVINVALKYMTYIEKEDVNNKVGVIVALPTSGECASPDVAKNSHELLNKLSSKTENKEIAPLLVVDNDKIKRLYPNLTVKSFWPTVNNTIAGLYHTLNVITTHSSAYTTFDPTDYNSLLSQHGFMIMGCTTVRDPSTSELSKAIKSNLEKTLLAGGLNLSTAKGVGVVILGGASLFENIAGLMGSIEAAFDTVATIVGNALVHRGIYEVESDKLRVYTLISGLSKPKERIEELLKFHKNT